MILVSLERAATFRKIHGGNKSNQQGISGNQRIGQAKHQGVPFPDPAPRPRCGNFPCPGVIGFQISEPCSAWCHLTFATSTQPPYLIPGMPLRFPKSADWFKGINKAHARGALSCMVSDGFSCMVSDGLVPVAPRKRRGKLRLSSFRCSYSRSARGRAVSSRAIRSCRCRWITPTPPFRNSRSSRFLRRPVWFGPALHSQNPLGSQPGP